jgi:hypothetical protein
VADGVVFAFTCFGFPFACADAGLDFHVTLLGVSCAIARLTVDTMFGDSRSRIFLIGALPWILCWQSMEES